MAETPRRLVVAVRTRGAPRRVGEVMRWLRCLVPAAVLLVAPAPSSGDTSADDPGHDGDEVLTIDADALDAGPLAVAAALVRAHERR